MFEKERRFQKVLKTCFRGVSVLMVVMATALTYLLSVSLRGLTLSQR